MKIYLRLFLFVVLFNLIPSIPSVVAKPYNPEREMKQVQQWVETFFTAVKDKNIDALKVLLLDRGASYQFLGPEKKWNENSNSEFIQWMQSTQEAKFLTFEGKELDIKLIGGNKKMAFVTGKISASWAEGGYEQSDFMMILCKKGDTWYIQTYNKDIVEFKDRDDSKQVKPEEPKKE
ncbi:MAG: nuclear transport factor 2 family protein [Desulfobacterales bacterium]|nr:nuclear transport factor 2 family protein [Desulfobacterales bacterium]